MAMRLALLFIAAFFCLPMVGRAAECEFLIQSSYFDKSNIKILHVKEPACTANLSNIREQLQQHDIYGLNLVNVNITTLADVVATTKPSLKLLHLTNNNIRDLPRRSFSNLANLTYLSLRHNQIGSLHRSVFSHLHKLKDLFLAHNHLKTLPKKLFSNLPNLTRLSLSYNRFSKLRPEQFLGLTNLWSLSLENNFLTKLSGRVFSDLTNLWYLSLSNNKLTSLKTGLFHKLGKLSRLYLSNNPITDLPQGIFHGLFNLEHLDLRNLNLPFLAPGELLVLPRLRKLLMGQSQYTNQAQYEESVACATIMERQHPVSLPLKLSQDVKEAVQNCANTPGSRYTCSVENGALEHVCLCPGNGPAPTTANIITPQTCLSLELCVDVKMRTCSASSECIHNNVPVPYTCDQGEAVMELSCPVRNSTCTEPEESIKEGGMYRSVLHGFEVGTLLRCPGEDSPVCGQNGQWSDTFGKPTKPHFTVEFK